MATFFQFSEGRELVNEERASVLIAECAGKVSDPTRIRLSNKSFDNGAAQKISEIIGIYSNIQFVDISDIIAGRPEEEALRTVQIISSSLKRFDIIELDVSDNAFGAKGVEACRDILEGKKLEKLYLCNNGLSAEAVSLVASILLANGCPPLKLLHFYNNMSGSEGAKAVSTIILALPNLEDFRFSATRSGPEGCLAIAKAIGTLSQLRRIDLSDNTFGEEAAAMLATGLRSQSQLEYLNLRDDGLAQDGVQAVIAALGTAAHPNLVHLDLSGNDINEDIAAELATVLPKLKALEKLFVDDNEVGSDGAKALAKALKGLKRLVTFSCCTCEITAAGAVAVAKAVASVGTFRNLELNGNEICESGVEKVQEILKGKGKVLGEMEDNDEDGDDDLESDEEEEEDAEEEEEHEEDAVDKEVEDQLAEALESTKI